VGIPEFIARLFVTNVKTIEGKKIICVLETLNINNPFNFFQHLETFSCGLYLKIGDIDDITGIGQFCKQLEQIFNSQQGANKKLFKFRLVANGFDWENYRR
jgi:hypothetical protein